MLWDEILSTLLDYQVLEELKPTETLCLSLDYGPSNVVLPDPRARLVLLEDNEAVIKMTIKQHSPH